MEYRISGLADQRRTSNAAFTGGVVAQLQAAAAATRAMRDLEAAGHGDISIEGVRPRNRTLAHKLLLPWRACPVPLGVCIFCMQSFVSHII